MEKKVFNLQLSAWQILRVVNALLDSAMCDDERENFMSAGASRGLASDILHEYERQSIK